LPSPYFASLEGNPLRGVAGEAWIYHDAKWKPFDSADAAVNAALLTEEEFTTRFGQLPDLPKTAFRDADGRAATPS
jgi:hypothetical protein